MVFVFTVDFHCIIIMLLIKKSRLVAILNTGVQYNPL